MKVMLLAGLVLFTSCFTPTYRRDPYAYRTDRYYSYDRYDRAERGRFGPHATYRGKMVRRLPRHAQIQRRGGETWAWTHNRVFVWDEYRRGWVRVR